MMLFFYLRLQRYWYQSSLHPVLWGLWPISWLFRLILWLKQWFKRCNQHSVAFPLPIVVVGNLTVGGTGKTPFTIALVHCLQQTGWRPGIISRGRGKQQVLWVNADTAIHLCGDEAMLLYEQTQCPVVVSKNRYAAALALLAHTNCNVIVSDDGLQHLTLPRDLEILLIDADRGLGNQRLLPAGPLREPLSRLRHVDFIVLNQRSALNKAQATHRAHQQQALATLVAPQRLQDMLFEGQAVVWLANPAYTLSLAEFTQRYLTVHALAAIGHPDAFFAMLRAAGLVIISHYFQDHYHYREADLIFPDQLPIMMTEKDAVKCRQFTSSTLSRLWYVPVVAKLDATLQTQVLQKLELLHKQKLSLQTKCRP